jgi:hypothetical protein
MVLRYGHRKPMGMWEVFIKDHHEGYISWADYERNQALLASNAYRPRHQRHRPQPRKVSSGANFIFAFSDAMS